MSLCTSPEIEVRHKNLLQFFQVNKNSSNIQNSGTPSSKVPSSGPTSSSQSTPFSPIMVGGDMKIPVFNGNG